MSESMSEQPTSEKSARKIFLVGATIGITLLFLFMIRSFLMAVLMAAIFSGMAHPFYEALARRMKGRTALASATTILVILLVVGVPVLTLVGLVAGQAVEVSQDAGPWIERQVAEVGALDERIQQIPFLDRVPGLRAMLPSGEEIVSKAGEIAASTGGFLVGSVADATRGTMGFFLQLFIMIYSMFFFLLGGRRILDRILYFVPLTDEEEELLVGTFVSVTRATLKGSFLIGVIQGVLAGAAYWVVGIPGAAFWGTVTAVASLIPAIGAALVWVPMVLFLLVTGQVGGGVGLLLWSVLVVSTVDNFLRPRLVGRDISMPDLLILLSTLGGLTLFGAVGVMVGPIVASLFVTVWHLYGETFGGGSPTPGVGVPGAEVAAEVVAEVAAES